MKENIYIYIFDWWKDTELVWMGQLSGKKSRYNMLANHEVLPNPFYWKGGSILQSVTI